MATLDDAKASLARGEGRIITQQSMRELAEDVKQRGLAPLVAEQPAPPLMAYLATPRAAVEPG